MDAPHVKGSDLTPIPNKMATFTIAAPSPEQISSLRARQKKKFLKKILYKKSVPKQSFKEGKNDFIKVLTWYYFHNLKLNNKGT